MTSEPVTLTFDIGASGLKAAVLDAAGSMIGERVRVETKYPCPPDQLVTALATLAGSLPSYDRVSAGFPGMVRGGVVLAASQFATANGPGSPPSPKLQRAWDHFDLAAALKVALQRPARVVNDADLAGLGVARGAGLEMAMTLGTGFGTALLLDGHLLPHLELAHQRFRKSATYDQRVGDRARRRIGNARWTTRVRKAVDEMRALTFFDRAYVGGGNAKRLTGSLGEDVEIVTNDAGLLGGIKLWDEGQVAGGS